MMITIGRTYSPCSSADASQGPGRGGRLAGPVLPIEGGTNAEGAGPGAWWGRSGGGGKELKMVHWASGLALYTLGHYWPLPRGKSCVYEFLTVIVRILTGNSNLLHFQSFRIKSPARPASRQRGELCAPPTQAQAAASGCHLPSSVQDHTEIAHCGPTPSTAHQHAQVSPGATHTTSA